MIQIFWMSAVTKGGKDRSSDSTSVAGSSKRTRSFGKRSRMRPTRSVGIGIGPADMRARGTFTVVPLASKRVMSTVNGTLMTLRIFPSARSNPFVNFRSSFSIIGSDFTISRAIAATFSPSTRTSIESHSMNRFKAPRISLMAVRLLFALLVAGSLAAADAPYEVVAFSGGSIAVPKEWRSLPVPIGLFRVGDGIGVPAVDETGEPLQIGMSVQKFGVAKESLQEMASTLSDAAKNAPNLEPAGKEIVEPIKLADGTNALLLTFEFIKEGSRRSLQMKLVTKDAGNVVWIASAHLVGGKNSGWPKPGSSLAKWLAAHLTSLTFDAKKFDAAKVEAAYADR